jgi:glutamate synthase (NADPH/NADH) small chain
VRLSPAWDAERNECLDAGVHFLVLNQPMGYETDENGRVCGVRIARTELGEPDASGRRRPLVLEETENTLAGDMVNGGATAVEAIAEALL